MKTTRIERTKKGYPAFWEAGGGFTNTGEATIIANKDGQPKKALYVRSGGQLANGEHALVILEVGDYIIEANHHREDFKIKIYKVLDFEVKKEETYAVMEQANCFSRGEWDVELPAYLEAAVQAAVEKATCYHCREPHFITVRTA
jgi:hypothetical protein